MTTSAPDAKSSSNGPNPSDMPDWSDLLMVAGRLLDRLGWTRAPTMRQVSPELLHEVRQARVALEAIALQLDALRILLNSARPQTPSVTRASAKKTPSSKGGKRRSR